jgi:hypothetical protein
LEACQISKLQNGSSLFDIELYFTVHKTLLVSISLNIIIHSRALIITNHESLLGSRASPTFYDVGQEHIGQLRIVAVFSWFCNPFRCLVDFKHTTSDMAEQ